jgi:RHS repeat-associated protein
MAVGRERPWRLVVRDQEQLTKRSERSQRSTGDGLNRMRSASTYGKTTTFSYDALGRRIAKRSEHDVTLFGWDGDTLAFESTQSTEGQQELQAWRGDSVHYIHEPGSFVPLVQIRQAQAVALSQTTDVKALIAANGGRYDIEQDPLWNGQQFKTPQAFVREEIAFYQCDHLGTPQELTDHEGRIAWSAQYKAWGEAKQAISEAGRKAGFRNPIRFQGQYFDDETGLHYNRHRYYDPHSGRFTSSDPIKLRGGINLHRYVLSPVQWIDPLGLAELSQAPDFDTARRRGFERAGMTNPENVSFSKMDPATGTVVEFKGPGGAKVAYDAPHADLDATQGHDKPHVGWQTAGKRGCGCGKRGNITYEGPQHPHRPDEKL